MTNPCSCILRFAPISADFFEAQARVNVANMEHPDGSIVCRTPCTSVLATIAVGEYCRNLKRPFAHEWSKRYRQDTLSC